MLNAEVIFDRQTKVLQKIRFETDKMTIELLLPEMLLDQFCSFGFHFAIILVIYINIQIELSPEDLFPLICFSLSSKIHLGNENVNTQRLIG